MTKDTKMSAGRKEWVRVTIDTDDTTPGLYEAFVGVLEESHASASVTDRETGRVRSYYEHPELGQFIVESEGFENDEVVFEAPGDMVQAVFHTRCN